MPERHGEPSGLETVDRKAKPWQFRRGTSGNPTGRPKGFAGLARRIARETKDGQELVRFALSVLRGEPITVTRRVVHLRGAAADVVTWQETPDLARRMEALVWLADRWVGKPVQVMPGEGGGAPVWLIGLMGQVRDPLALSAKAEDEEVALDQKVIDVRALPDK